MPLCWMSFSWPSLCWVPLCWMLWTHIDKFNFKCTNYLGELERFITFSNFPRVLKWARFQKVWLGCRYSQYFLINYFFHKITFKTFLRRKTNREHFTIKSKKINRTRLTFFCFLNFHKKSFWESLFKNGVVFKTLHSLQTLWVDPIS